MLVADFRRVHGMETTLDTLRGPFGEVKGQLIQPRERGGEGRSIRVHKGTCIYEAMYVMQWCVT